ncbi:sugar phosphate nucleotidyltransferase [Pigmentibacter sp. JX0631]|uniref:mannose-1-phosphate guanylyltransferase n=1 Tax=Pigmentibacter sp. JX0631 TaxID=2976982 RepID=UPI0024684F25|nr:sugar phosphate nucleotidyltransferase [Pigmentibacter sp. JX0631]WGL60252.1 sugar phosphate nucleotidyltransferase [Pigmentibacter sp. JX0631]
MKSDLLENFDNNDIYSIILCGGSGTRLWPLSRKSFPKQFLSLGEKQKTLLQLTIDRVKNLSPLQNRWLVTAQCQENLCANQVSQQIAKIIIEPEARNTAPAIALTAWELMQENPDSIMVILSSDHSIQNVRSFEQTILDAIKLAKNNLFVTVGIQPTHPATGFGYIEQGLPLDNEGNILSPQRLSETTPTGYSVRSFREKPNQAAAEQFIRTQKYLWNAGIFVWKTKTFWNAYSHIQPEAAKLIESINKYNISEVYKKLENIPIDIAFIEQTSHVACVPANFDWNDVGSWSAVRECFEQDSQGNNTSGEVFLLDTKNSVVHSTGPFVSVIGMENVAVVASEDAILVMPLNRSQDVKKTIQYLETKNPKLL